MKAILSTILIYCLMITTVFAQATNPSDTYKIGKGSSSSDKGLIFDTNDGVSNKKLIIEKTSKKLKFDGNNFQIGDGSGSSDKTLSINGASKSLKYNGTSGEFEFDDTLKLSSDLKTNTISPASGTETNFPQDARVTDQLFIGGSTNQLRTSGGNLEFSNDGSLFKKIGSGSGSGGSGGTQLLENDSFEDGLTPGWTSSGGTFSQQTYTNSSDGDTKYARFIASGSGQYFESIAKAIPDSVTGGCQADFKKYNTATASAFKIEAMDTTGATIYATQTLSAGSWIKAPTISFVCPAAATLVKIRVTSLSAATIEVDKGYIGSNQNLVNTIASNDIDWTDYTPTFSAGFGSVTITKAKYKRKGADLYLMIKFTTGTVAASAATITLPNSSLTSSHYNTYELVGSVGKGNAIAITNSVIAGPSSNTLAFSGQGASNASLTAYNGNDLFASTTAYSILVGPLSITGWTEVRQQDIAISNEQMNWYVDANIGGANAAGSANQSSYVEFTNSSLDLVINSSKGSSGAEIACASGTASTGLTCSSNESVGIAFTPPMPGRYKVCFDFTGNHNSIAAAFQIAETSNISSAILVEGGTRVSGNLPTLNGSIPYSVCGNFSFSDTSKRTIRLMYESQSGTAINVISDRSSSLGQNDIHVTVENITFGQNRPFLTGDQVTSPGAVKPVKYVATVTSAGVVTEMPGTDWINGNCPVTSTNVFTCTLVAGKFTGNPICFPVIKNPGGAGRNAVMTTETSATVIVNTYSSATAEANNFNIECNGLAP